MVDLATVRGAARGIVHWESPVASASTLGFVLTILVSICYYSFISVVAYISLTLLAIVLCIKIYSYVMVFMKKVNIVCKVSSSVRHCQNTLSWAKSGRSSMSLTTFCSPIEFYVK
jgi:hypothetical protein